MTTISRRATGRRGVLALVFALTSLAALAGASAAHADCCMGGPSAPADFHARAIPGAPVALLPVTVIQVSSEAPADYTARVDIRVGKRILARSTGHGHSDTTWSPLRIPVSARQRRAVTAAARHERRRPILDVQLRGTLAGRTDPSIHALELVVSIPGARATGELPDVGSEQRTRISLAGLGVDGARQSVAGRVVIRTPRATFTRTNGDASPTAHFTFAATSGCQGTLLVSKLAEATHLSASDQARSAVAGADRLLGTGNAHGRLWALAEYPVVSDQTGVPTGAKRLAGLTITRIATGRWMHVRTFADFAAGCTEQDRNSGAFVKAMKRMLWTVQVDARIVAPAR